MGACNTNLPQENDHIGNTTPGNSDHSTKLTKGHKETDDGRVTPEQKEYRTLRSIPSISALQEHVDEIRRQQKNRDHSRDHSHSYTALVKGFSFDSRLSALSDLPLSYSHELDSHFDVYDRCCSLSESLGEMQ